MRVTQTAIFFHINKPEISLSINLNTKKHQYQKGRRQELYEARTDPRKFWQLVKTTNQAKDTSRISDTQWRNYFSSLLYCEVAPSINTINETEFEADRTADTLNEEISLSEVLSSIRQLKCGKSPGPDCIGAEFYLNTATVTEISPILKDLLIESLTRVYFPPHGDGAYCIQYIKVARFQTLGILGEFR